jgi:hypothetical protein
MAYIVGLKIGKLELRVEVLIDSADRLITTEDIRQFECSRRELLT